MDLFQRFLNQVGRGYGQVDKNVFGGLLPGGAASQVSPVRKKIQQQAATTVKTLAGGLMNQLPDRVNLFGRYVTGVGNTNLRLDPSTLNSLRAAATPEPIGKGLVPNPIKIPDEFLVSMEQQLKTGDARNLDSPLGKAFRERIEEAKRNRDQPDFVLGPVPAYGPGLPQTGAYRPYGNLNVGKDVTNTLGSFNAEVIPGQSIRFIDTYDMENMAEDPALVSGKFQPLKAIEEIQSIWDPGKGGLNRSVPEEIRQRSNGKYGDVNTKASSQTESPATAVGRALLYAMPWKPTPYPIDVTIPY